MKKTKLTRSLLAACSIVALSVVLSGCLHSGGDDGDGMDTGGGTPTAPQLTLADVTDGVAVAPGTYTPNAALAAAFEDADESLLGVDYDEGAMITVEGVDLTCAVGPCRVTVNDDGTVTVAGTIHTADYMPEPTGPTDEEIAAEGARITAAIGSTPVVADADSNTDTVFERPFTADGSMPLTTSLAYDGTTTTVPDDEKFAASDDSPASIEGWAGTMHTRMRADDADTDDDEFLMDTVVSYTNEEDMTAAVWNTFFGATQDGVTTTSPDATTGSISLANDQSMNHMNVVADFGLTAANQNIPLPLDDPNTTEVEDDPLEFDGSFYGVSGTFTCSASCAVTSDAMGNLSMLTGTWTFAPTVAEGGMISDVMVPGVVRDTAYLTFGYWLRATNDEDGDLQYAFQAFAQGVPERTAVSTVEGTASYSGAATGLFVRSVFETDGSSTPVAAGQFTADASLNASFGGGTVAADDQWSISGMISNFMDADGDMIDENWTVMLNRGDNTDGDMDMNDAKNIGGGDGSTGAFSGVTTGGGTFSGQFYGIDDPDTTNVVEQPTGVAGTFDGHFSNGSVRGAFGAEKD